ncbi:MAG: SNF7 family protein [archaeon]|nr:SNF7 family protein [archaeon]
MKNLFGKKKEKKTETNPDKSLNDLNEQINALDAKIDYQQKQCDSLQNDAKAKLKAGDKNGAKKLLAKKKRIEASIKNLEGAQMMMEEQKSMLENAETMSDVYKVLQSSTQAVKEKNKLLDVDKLDAMKDDMEELKAQQEEVNTFFAEYNQEGNEELEDDLAALQEEIAKEDNQLPAAHQEEVNVVKEPKVQEADAKALEDFMA